MMCLAVTWLDLLCQLRVVDSSFSGRVTLWLPQSILEATLVHL